MTFLVSDMRGVRMMGARCRHAGMVYRSVDVCGPSCCGIAAVVVHCSIVFNVVYMRCVYPKREPLVLQGTHGVPHTVARRGVVGCRADGRKHCWCRWTSYRDCGITSKRMGAMSAERLRGTIDVEGITGIRGG